MSGRSVVLILVGVLALSAGAAAQSGSFADTPLTPDGATIAATFGQPVRDATSETTDAATDATASVDPATAQNVPPTDQDPPRQPPQDVTRPVRAEQRACDGCPPRSVGRAFAHATIINGAYGVANLIRGQETAKITPKTWWANMQNGWVWDLDDFVVNQFGHPYQGNNYFNAGRSNGLGFYESAAITAFGSATWEYYGETNMPSLNDLINTTLGGIALGEIFHRAAWLVRDPHRTGRGRLFNEIGAMVLDPVTGANRFVTGDASRITEKPPDMVPSSLSGLASIGAMWRGSQSNEFETTADPFLELDLLYGDVDSGRSRTPYDAFSFRLRLGGGAGISEAKVRGRLLGQPLKNGRLQFSVLQDYEFESNDAFHTGGQSLDASLNTSWHLTSRNRLLLIGWGGLTVLGAVDSLPIDLEAPPPEQENSVQGVSEGPRYYDYGPGSLFGVSSFITRDDRPLLNVFYEGRHLYSLDGVRANHLLQRFRLDVLLPVRGPFGAGITGEYFDRHTFYQDANQTRKSYRYPQLSAYVTWRLS